MQALGLEIEPVAPPVNPLPGRTVTVDVDSDVREDEAA